MTSAYHNPKAASWRHESVVDHANIQKFHESLPFFRTTPLISAPYLATELGVKFVFIKDESSRAGLPAFKILGAAWATFVAIINRLQLHHKDLCSFEGLFTAVKKAPAITLYAATEGNHGRAVARMANLLGLRAYIWVPHDMNSATRHLISSEGNLIHICVADGDYDLAVAEAHQASREDSNGLLIQDTSLEDYQDIPRFIVDGYSTLLCEINSQIAEVTPQTATHIAVPVGVGSLAQSVVLTYKSKLYAQKPPLIVTVEPANANPLQLSLLASEPVMVTTQETIMAGMNCGTVSPIAWPFLQTGVDISCCVDDLEVHKTVLELEEMDIEAGPCGAATLVAMRQLKEDDQNKAKLDHNSVIVLLCTEGKRSYNIPHKKSTL